MSNFFSERKKDDRKLFTRMGILSCTINEPIVAWRAFVIRREQNEILLRSIVKSYTYEVINTCELDRDKLCEQITINNKLYNIKTYTKRKDAIAFVIEKEKEEYGLLSSS